MELKPLWHFFPVTGLNITDKKLYLDKPLFNKATLISKANLSKLIKKNKITIDLANRIEEFIATDEVNCFIAINIKSVEYDPTNVNEELERRYLAIISALTLFTLVQSDYKQACRPTNTYFYNGLKTLTLHENHATWNINFLRNPLIGFFPNVVEKYTIAKLRVAIKKSDVRKTLKIILQSDKNIHNSIRTAMTSSVKHFANALYTDSAGEIITATITSFEMLLKINTAKDDDIKARLDVLAGFDKYTIDNLYKARNEWVHEGKSPDRKAAQIAIHHFTNSLEIFSEIVFRLPATIEHKVILQWLDYHAFIRAKYKEMPGKLKSICTILCELDPFEIAESINRPIEIWIYAFSSVEGWLPTWSNSDSTKKSTPSKQILRCMLVNEIALQEVLTKVILQNTIFSQNNLSDFNSEIKKLLNAHTMDEVKQKTIYFLIKKTSDKYTLEIYGPLIKAQGSNYCKAKIKFQEDQNLLDIATKIIEYLKNQNDLK